MGKKLDLDTMLKIVTIRSRDYNLHHDEIAAQIQDPGLKAQLLLQLGPAATGSNRIPARS